MQSKMFSTQKRATWISTLLVFGSFTYVWCLEETLLLNEKDLCSVPGVADVRGCEWIVEQLQDQNPDQTYAFSCSKEEQCNAQTVGG